ncbi:hypothetical protein D9M68_870960 [compost metagenome]
MRPLQVGTLHARVGLHLGGGTIADHAPSFENDDAVRDAVDHAQVMLYDHDRQAFQQFGHKFQNHGSLGMAHPGGRLIQQHDLRRGGESDCEFQLPLLAVRQLFGTCVMRAPDAHPAQPTGGAFVQRRVGIGRPPRIPVPRAGAALHAEPHVLQQGELREDVCLLEAAADTEARALSG